MTKYFGYKYLVNWPMIIEIYENPLGYFYCLLHTVRVKEFTVLRFWNEFSVRIQEKGSIRILKLMKQQNLNLSTYMKIQFTILLNLHWKLNTFSELSKCVLYWHTICPIIKGIQVNISQSPLYMKINLFFI